MYTLTCVQRMYLAKKSRKLIFCALSSQLMTYYGGQDICFHPRNTQGLDTQQWVYTLIIKQVLQVTVQT